MCPRNDNQIDWTAASTPRGEAVVPSLSRQPRPKPVQQTRSSVMDTLLGANNLSASDVSGNDPYNTTGRHFRR